MNEIITQNKAMKGVLEQIRQISALKVPVLFRGEAGTGRRQLSQLVHNLSSRKGMAYRVLSCDVFADEEMTSEQVAMEFERLCAEMKGRGTLVLEHIDSASFEIQQCIAHKIAGQADIRFIAISALPASGASALPGRPLASDLGQIFGSCTIDIPALRDRLGDVMLLANRMIVNYAKRHARTPMAIDAEGIKLLEDHSWPGNIRELASVMERAVLQAKGSVLGARDFQFDQRKRVQPPQPTAVQLLQPSGASAHEQETSASAGSWVPGTTMDEIEKQVILHALRHYSGNRTHTAKALGISIRTLRNKLADYRRLGIHV